MALNDVYQASIIFSHPQADGPVVNVVHYRLDLIITPRNEESYCGQLSGEIVTLAVAGIIPSLTANWELEEVVCFNLNQPQFQASTPSGVTGSNVSPNDLPIRSAPLISKRTGLRGRSFRGRMYLPSITEESQQAGEIIPAEIVILDAYGASLINIVTAGDLNQFNLEVYSPTLSTPPTIIVATPVATMTTNGVLATIRGRQVTN